MKKLRRLLTMLLTLIMLVNINLTAFASTKDTFYETINVKVNKNVIVTDTGIYINANYYSQEQFIELLDTAQEVQTPQTRSAIALATGTWLIPGIGQVIITTTGAVIVAGTVVAVGSWIHNAVKDWFAQRAEINVVKANIPSRLKDENGNVKVGDFNQKVSGKTAYKEKGGWTIEKDTAGHGGRKWKLKDKSGNRIASLDENGKVLGK